MPSLSNSRLPPPPTCAPMIKTIIDYRGGSRNSSTGGFWAGILRGGGGLGSRSAGIFIY